MGQNSVVLYLRVDSSKLRLLRFDARGSSLEIKINATEKYEKRWRVPGLDSVGQQLHASFNEIVDAGHTLSLVRKPSALIVQYCGGHSPARNKLLRDSLDAFFVELEEVLLDLPQRRAEAERAEAERRELEARERAAEAAAAREDQADFGSVDPGPVSPSA